ncbi:MAG: glutamine synthetase, partial [Clostridia bacterium]|nr:glutamine synthetase [Clostridia bacterium]
MLADEVLRFVEENNVKFIRLAFLDLFGRLKNIAIMPDQLSRAFETGIPLDATAVDGFEAATDGNLLLRPDPATMTILPWRPQA